MDGSRFDALARTLTTAGSRRRALGGLLLGALGLLTGGSADDAAAHDLKAKCKMKSGAAKKKCLKKARKHAAQHANETPPPPPGPAFCAGKPDDTNCNGGKCLNGTCNPTPTCKATDEPCPTGSAECCSRNCSGGSTGRCSGISVPDGGSCQVGRDCISGLCIGHRCTGAGTCEEHEYCGDASNTSDDCPCLATTEGYMRTGVQPPRPGFSCGDCTSSAECIARLGRADAFCAVDSYTGNLCPCASNQRFCALPCECTRDEHCASGQCGCTGSGVNRECTCRNSTCRGFGAACDPRNSADPVIRDQDCCEGQCGATGDPQRGVCCRIYGEPCAVTADCCNTASGVACVGGFCRVPG